MDPSIVSSIHHPNPASPPDTSSFPLLLLHEIPLHSSPTLVDSYTELLAFPADGPLGKFAAKLLPSISDEIDRRVAQQRITNLLEGIDCDNVHPLHEIKLAVAPAAALNEPYASTSTAATTNTAANAIPKMIPLPSQTISTNSTKRSLSPRPSSTPSAIQSTTAPPSSITTSSTPRPTPTQSLPHATPDSPPSSASKKPRRKSQYSQEALDEKSRKSFNANFGTVHVVTGGGTGGIKGRARAAKDALRRRSSLNVEKEHKKKVMEDKARRRKIALERLNDRQKRREKGEEKRKEKELKKQRKEERERKLHEEASRAAQEAAERAESEAIIAGKDKTQVMCAKAAAAATVIDKEEEEQSEDSEESLSADEEESAIVDQFRGIEKQVQEQEEEAVVQRQVVQEPVVKEAAQDDTRPPPGWGTKSMLTTYEEVSEARSTRALEAPARRVSGVGFFAPPPPVEVVETTIKKTTYRETGGVKQKVAEEVTVEVEVEAERDSSPQPGCVEQKAQKAPKAQSSAVKVAVEAEREASPEPLVEVVAKPKVAEEVSDKAERSALQAEKSPEPPSFGLELALPSPPRAAAAANARVKGMLKRAAAAADSGDLLRAAAEYEKVLKLDPNNDVAKGQLSEMEAEEEERVERENGVLRGKQEEEEEEEEEAKELVDDAEDSSSADEVGPPAVDDEEDESSADEPNSPDSAPVRAPLLVPSAVDDEDDYDDDSSADERAPLHVPSAVDVVDDDYDDSSANEPVPAPVDPTPAAPHPAPSASLPPSRPAPAVVARVRGVEKRASKYEAEGNLPAAIAEYRKILKLDPANANASAQLAKLDSSPPASPELDSPELDSPDSAPPSPTAAAPAVPPLLLASRSDKENESTTISDHMFSTRKARIDGVREREAAGWTPRSEVKEIIDSSVTAKLVPPEANLNNPKKPNPANTTERKFTDVFPHFSHIFSAYYERDNISSAKQGFGSSSGSRRGQLSQTELAATMHYQWWLFSVFGQVMDDYTTVFSGAPTKSKSKPVVEAPDSASDSSDDDGGLDWEPESKSSKDLRRGEKAFYDGDKRSLLFRVNSSRAEVYNIVNDVLSVTKPWVELPVGLDLKTSWNLLWTWSKPKVDYTSLLVFQKVNHFRNCKAITRKDHLKKHIERFCTKSGVTRNNNSGVSVPKSKFDDVFNIIPQSFVLPQEFNAFVKAFTQGQGEAAANSSRPNLWILKPAGMSRGRGIKVIDDIGSVSYDQTVVAQKYLHDPLLLDGYKFDLRIYVLVTSFSPLEVFVYKEGFARFSSVKFNTKSSDITNNKMHLTNSSIQPQKGGFASDNPTVKSQEDGGSKMTTSELWKRLEEKGVDTKLLWKRSCDCILKGLMCCTDSVPFQPSAFEVYGADVIFDEGLNPWLIEFNSSPAMARGTRIDEIVKESMIHDTAGIVDPPKFDREALVRVCARRMEEMQKKGKSAMSAGGVGGGGEKERLEKDLSDILMGKIPRQYGEVPENMGNYQMLAPGTPYFDKLQGIVGKMFVKAVI